MIMSYLLRKIFPWVVEISLWLMLVAGAVMGYEGNYLGSAAMSTLLGAVMGFFAGVIPLGMLQTLIRNNILLESMVKDGYGRWASYRLPERLARSGHNADGTPDTTALDSGHKEITPDTSEQAMTGPPEETPALLAIAEPARNQERLAPKEMRRLIRTLCQGRSLTFRQLATLLKREPGGLQRWHLRPMFQDGQLVMLYPDNPNHPKQAYQTNPNWRES